MDLFRACNTKPKLPIVDLSDPPLLLEAVLCINSAFNCDCLNFPSLSVVFVTRAVYFHVNVICLAAKHLKFDSRYSNHRAKGLFCWHVFHQRVQLTICEWLSFGYSFNINDWDFLTIASLTDVSDNTRPALSKTFRDFGFFFDVNQTITIAYNPCLSNLIRQQWALPRAEAAN